MIDFGINRVRYASGVIDALLMELKEASIAGKCKVLAAIDGYNTFWSDNTRVRNDDKVFVNPRQISLTLSFLNFIKSDWCNGAAVLTLDAKMCKVIIWNKIEFLLTKYDKTILYDFNVPMLVVLITNNCIIMIAFRIEGNLIILDTCLARMALNV